MQYTPIIISKTATFYAVVKPSNYNAQHDIVNGAVNSYHYTETPITDALQEIKSKKTNKSQEQQKETNSAEQDLSLIHI